MIHGHNYGVQANHMVRMCLILRYIQLNCHIGGVSFTLNIFVSVNIHFLVIYVVIAMIVLREHYSIYGIYILKTPYK